MIGGLVRCLALVAVLAVAWWALGLVDVEGRTYAAGEYAPGGGL